MAVITLAPGQQPSYYEPTYSVQHRQGKNSPWHGEHMHMGIKDYREALIAAQRKLDNAAYLIVRVVDQRGKVYWTNEDAAAPPT